jgi:membrane-associated protein
MFFGIDLTHLIQILGYPGLFAIIMAESGLFFAVYLPGGSLLFTAGLLASQGYLNIYILLAVVITAAIIGDTIGYWFGAWVGPALWRRPDSRFLKKSYLEQTRIFFDKHGSRTILLARFIPVVRTFAPILAGVAQMNYRTFFFYNAIGAVVWGGGFVLGGYFLGETVPGVDEYLELFIFGIVAITTIPFFWHLYSARKQAKGPSHGYFSAEKFRDPASPRQAPALRRGPTPISPRAIIFDLDDTLAESFQPPTEDMLRRLGQLASHTPIAIMTAASHERVEKDVMARLTPNSSAAFYILTDSTARGYSWQKNAWKESFVIALSPEERTAIEKAARAGVEETNVFGATDTPRILVRETSVAITAARPDATSAEKSAWDPGGMKRQRLQAVLQAKLPQYEVLIGGKTTIDITKRGVTKAHGVEWLAKELSLQPSDMLFIGDGFYEGGNDAVVIPTGVQTLSVDSPADTLRAIEDLTSRY